MTLKLNGYKIKYSLNKTWLLIFRHNSVKGGFFIDSNEARFSMNPNKFSLLSRINSSFKVTNDNADFFYEFILEYPELEGFNHWSQELFPSDERTETDQVGYKELSQISWSNSYWGGLALNEHEKESSYIDGSPLTQTWHFAIGAYKSYLIDNQFPGPCLIQNSCKNSVSEVKLWMRLDNPELIHCFPIIRPTCKIRRSYKDKRFSIASMK